MNINILYDTKRILMPLVVAAIALAMVACGTKTTKTDKDMNTLTFTTKQAAAMTVIACNEVRGDLSSLAGAIREGFEAGLTANLRDRAFYLFSRSLNRRANLMSELRIRFFEGATVAHSK